MLAKLAMFFVSRFYYLQVCSNGTRVFVEKSILNEFLDKLVDRTKKIRVGDPMDPTTQMGALISEEHLTKVLGYVDTGRTEVR